MPQNIPHRSHCRTTAGTPVLLCGLLVVMTAQALLPCWMVAQGGAAVTGGTWVAAAGLWLLGTGMAYATHASCSAGRDWFDTFFNAVPMPLVQFDMNLAVVRVNEALRKRCPDTASILTNEFGAIIGCINAGDDAQGCGSSPVCASCSITADLQRISREGGKTRGEAQLSHADPSGVPTFTWILYDMERVDVGGASCLLMSFVDITERKQFEQDLLLLHHAFNRVADTILLIDDQLRIIYANDAACHSLGYSRQELTTMSPIDIDPKTTRQRCREIMDSTFEAGWVAPFESCHRARDGRTFPVEVSMTRVEFDGRTMGMAVVSDISQRKQLEEVLRQHNEEQQRLQAQLLQAQKMESIGRLSGGIAHDFNNVLAVIGGYGELLQLSLERNDDERLSYAREITRSVKRGAELTRGLLTFSGKHEPKLEQHDLNQILADMRSSFSRLIRSDIVLSFEMSSGELPVLIDQHHIEQVLLNLLVNARDAVASGGSIRIASNRENITAADPRICSHTLSPGPHAVVTVSDDGIGMDEATMAQVFEPFFTTKGATGQGVGLGLSICYGIVAKHNGHIAVASAPGRGSRFSIYLPLARESAVAGQVTAVEPVQLSGSETILLADDDPHLLNLQCELFRRYGYDVLAAANGTEALELYDTHRSRISALVLDMIMPRYSGRDIIELIRKEDPALPVVLVSGYASDIIGEETIAALNIKFVKKPVGYGTLLALIRTELDGRNSTAGACVAHNGKFTEGGEYAVV